MDVTLEAIAAEISKQLGGVENRLAAHVSGEVSKGVDVLKHQAELHREGLRQDVLSAAEGYGANLDRIERELAALNRKVDTKFGDHDLVLADHNRRIVKLERVRGNQG